MRTENLVLNPERNVRMTAYIQDVGGEFGFQKRPAMLILPGGGYTICSCREADPAAAAYLKAGYQVFILHYTMKDTGGWPYPLSDYEQAMEQIAAHAEEWHLDPEKTVVCGFSAGGHLAACAATMAEHRPSAAVLVYPVILSEYLALCQPGMPAPDACVSAACSPCFLAAARDDRMIDIRNTLSMEMALAEHGVIFESHIYSYGGHGFSTGEEWVNTARVCPRVRNWVSDSIEWLSEIMGKFTGNGFAAPIAIPGAGADAADFLSINCSLRHIERQGDEVKQLLSDMYAGIDGIAEEWSFSREAVMSSLAGCTLSEILEMIHIPEKTKEELDRKLRMTENHTTHQNP